MSSCNSCAPVSIAKAIPSLLEPILAPPPHGIRVVSIAKAIPSLLEQAEPEPAILEVTGFNRESDSVTVGAMVLYRFRKIKNVSIAKAIPSLLEPISPACAIAALLVSIAKAIPSLLEQLQCHPEEARIKVSIAKAIPSLLEPYWPAQYMDATVMFQSRKRFRHCWSLCHRAIRSDTSVCFNRESDSVTVGAPLPYG